MNRLSLALLFPLIISSHLFSVLQYDYVGMQTACGPQITSLNGCGCAVFLLVTTVDAQGNESEQALQLFYER